MAYNIVTGDIKEGVLYYVAGDQSIVYNTITYNTGDYFRGANDKTFKYTGIGTQVLNEVTEITGSSIEFLEDSIDQPVYAESTILKIFNIEYELNDDERIINEITNIQGFALELIDYPFYSFEITEAKL